jgi:hypothetical protein
MMRRARVAGGHASGNDTASASEFWEHQRELDDHAR